MAELIWRLVLKINARAVFLLTLLLLCVVLVALLRGGGRQEGTLKVSGHRVQLAGGGPGESQSGPGPAWAETIEDPFTSAFLVAWLDLEASRKREREAVRAQQAAAEEAAPVAATPTPAPTPAKREPKWIGVTYQGMVSRTDGTRVALVVEAEGDVLHTVKVGDMLLAGHVKEITAERVVLTVGADTEHPLRVGVVTRVPKDGS